VGLATQPRNGEIELTPQMHQILATQIPHLYLLEVLPDPFPGVQVRRIRGELLHMDLFRTTDLLISFLT
jgi:hypothetical protein